MWRVEHVSYLPDERPSAAATPASATAASDPSPGATSPASTRSARHRENHGFGRFLGLTTLGTIVPGAGLLGAGWRRTGAVILGLFVGLGLVVLAYFYWRGLRGGATYLASRTDLFDSLAMASIVVIAIWLLSILMTGWAARPQPAGMLRGLGATLFTLLMAAVLVVPTVYLGQRALIGRDLLNKVFEENRITTPTAATNTPHVEQADPWQGIDRVNVLLLGTDAYPGRPSIRTDSMMLASTNTQTGDTLLIGIPRNLTGWHIRETSPMRAVWPDGIAYCGRTNIDNCELTNYWRTVGEYVKEHPEAYPGDKMPSLTALREVIGDFTNLTIDNVAMIDIRGFSSLVDALGGVDINVLTRLPYGYKLRTDGTIVPGSEAGILEPGMQHLTGYQAMWYARARGNGQTDFDRMRRQRCVIGALARQVSPAKLVQRFPELAKAAQDNLLFDISLSQLPAWQLLGDRIQKGKIRSLPFTSKLFDNVKPDYDWVHAYIGHALDPDFVEAPTTDGYGRPLPTASPSPSTSPTKTPGKSASPSTTVPQEGVVDVADAC